MAAMQTSTETIRLARRAERTKRRLKAKLAGYHVSDEYFYTRRMIRKLLPYARDPQATPPPILAEELEINRKHAGKEGYGGWEAAIADIRKALQAGCRDVRAIQDFLGGPSPWR